MNCELPINSYIQEPKQIPRAVVSIWSKTEKRILGTGVFIRPRILLTCEHVIKTRKHLQVIVYYPHKLVYIDCKSFYNCKSMDFSLLEVPEPFDHLVLGNSDCINEQTKLTIWCPHERKQNATATYIPHVPVFEDKIHDRSYAIKGDYCPPGTSGAPVLDENGFIMALHWGGGAKGEKGKYSFIMPINEIKKKLLKINIKED